MSVDSFLTYLSLERNYSPHTVQAYSRDIAHFQEFCRQRYDLDSIDEVAYGIIRSWIVQLVDNHLSNRSVNRKVASLKAYYRFLLGVEKITASPLARHKSLKTAMKVEIPFSENEMDLVLEELPYDDGFEGIRDKMVIDLLYATGIRRSELIHLKVKDVDVSARTIKVLGKRNKERIIPLLDSICQGLPGYLKARESVVNNPGEPYFFITGSGHKMYGALVYRIINKYFSRVSSKIKKSPHILRHTFATHLLSKGAGLNAVKELLGHSSLASTQVYTHNSIAELKKAHAAAHPRSDG